MSNKVFFGLEKVHVAFYDEEMGLWDTTIPIPGAVSKTLTPEGDQTIFYADNVAYHTVNTNNGYMGELEMALVRDAVLAEMFGWEVDSNGLLVEISDGEPKPFALLYEVQGNEFNKRYVDYHCTASRPKEEHKTRGDKTEPGTSTISITVAPINIDDRMIVKAVIELGLANASAFNGFFDAVLEPSFAVS